MGRRLEEITATLTRLRTVFENPSGAVAIWEADEGGENGEPEKIVLKGPVEQEGDTRDPQERLSYRFYGYWFEHPKYGRQFVYQDSRRATPHTRAAVVTYLEHHCTGIGRVRGGALFDKFGGDTVRILRESPEVAAAACRGLTIVKAEAAAKALEAAKVTEDAEIEIRELLHNRGFPRQLPKRAIRDLGGNAAELIKASPYILMKFRGCGFKLCDALYLELGHDPAAIERQSLCAWYTVASSKEGDTWHNIGEIDAGLRNSVGGVAIDRPAAMSRATGSGLLEQLWSDGKDGPPHWDGSCEWVAEAGKARAERNVAEYVAEAMQEKPTEVDSIALDKLSEHQADELLVATTRNIGCLCGSPGTGKTYAAAGLIEYYAETIGLANIIACAPTGKAAVRFSEGLQAAGIGLRARTIHSTLRVLQVEDGDGWTFEHNRSNPLKASLIVVDESSMIDTGLMASLLAARPAGCRILFVGDPGQLPPVGHGRPFFDMIDTLRVPVGMLREIRRNAGGIVRACADMRDGKQFECEDNLQHIGSHTVARIREDLFGVLAHCNGDLNPVWDFQVLVAVNKKSELSRKAINEELQRHLNSNDPVPGSPFRLGDKVVCTRNGYLTPVEGPNAWKEAVAVVEPGSDVVTNKDGQVYVANGEIGKVIKCEPRLMEIQLESPARLVRVPRGAARPTDDDSEEENDTGCNWDLAYALSVHKMQGSEIPVAIVLLDDHPGARRVADRAWLYTAISRAKQHCYLLGKLGTAHAMARRTKIQNRKTFLKELILERLEA